MRPCVVGQIEGIGATDDRNGASDTSRRLTGGGGGHPQAPEGYDPTDLDYIADPHAALTTTSETPFGQLTHLAPATQLSETATRWERPAVTVDHDEAVWLD
jgi:hypothetical protein